MRLWGYRFDWAAWRMLELCGRAVWRESSGGAGDVGVAEKRSRCTVVAMYRNEQKRCDCFYQGQRGHWDYASTFPSSVFISPSSSTTGSSTALYSRMSAL